MVAFVVELNILPVFHPGEAAGSRVPVFSHLIPWRLILTHEINPVGVADGAVEGQGEASDDDPEDGRRQCQGDERGARRPGNRRGKEYAEDDPENEAGKKWTEDEGALPPGCFSGLCLPAPGIRLSTGRGWASGIRFHENLRAGPIWRAAGGTSSSLACFVPLQPSSASGWRNEGIRKQHPPGRPRLSLRNECP